MEVGDVIYIEANSGAVKVGATFLHVHAIGFTHTSLQYFTVF